MTAPRRWVALLLAVLAAYAGLVGIHAPTAPLFAGLLGGMAVALLSRDGPPRLHRRWFLLAQAVVGVAVASEVDWGTLAGAGSDLPVLLLVTVGTIVVSVLSGLLLLVHRVSLVTATFSSVAGGASGMIALARDLGADDRVVTVVQYLRVLFILLTLPLVVSIAFPEAGPVQPSGVADASTAIDYVYVVVAATAGPLLGRLARLPSPALLGTLLVGSLLTLVPAFENPVVPGWVRAAGFLLLGTQVGLRFTRASLVAIGRMMPTALLLTVVTVVVCAGFGLVLAAATGESRLDSYLATTPGGLPAVLAASSATSANVTFVTAAQLIRLLLVLTLFPVVARLLFRTPAEADR